VAPYSSPKNREVVCRMLSVLLLSYRDSIFCVAVLLSADQSRHCDLELNYGQDYACAV